MESSHSSPFPLRISLIKEEDISDDEDAGEEGGWIAIGNAEGENDGADLLQAPQTARMSGIADEKTNHLKTILHPDKEKYDVNNGKKVTRARKSLAPSKRPCLSQVNPISDMQTLRIENGKRSVYYCDSCCRTFTSKKLYVTHKDCARNSRNGCARIVEFQRGCLKEKKAGETLVAEDSKRSVEEGNGMEEISEIRKRLGLRLKRSVPARFRDGVENYEESDDDDDELWHPAKELSAGEKEPIAIKGESSDEASSEEAENKRREMKALLQRIRRRRPRKLKEKVPNMCPQCGHCFKKKTDLQRHLRVHSGEKPYACEHCDMRFTRNFGLKCHMRTHSGLKMHVCATCGKSYSRRYDLVKHERAVHTGQLDYVCTECNKRFVTAQLLRVHERTHTNSQPYVCEECGHRSNHRSDLKKHMRTHTNERPYPCPFCKKSFIQSGTLTSHIANNH